MRAPSPIKPNPKLTVDTKISGISLTSSSNTSVPQLPPIPSVKSVRSDDAGNNNNENGYINNNEDKKKAIELYELYDFIRKHLEKVYLYIISYYIYSYAM